MKDDFAYKLMRIISNFTYEKLEILDDIVTIELLHRLCEQQEEEQEKEDLPLNYYSNDVIEKMFKEE